MADKNFKVKTGLDLPAPLPASEGGTGQTTLANALNALLPSQTSSASKILGTDGTNPLWVNPGAAYQTSAPDNPVTGQLWVDSDETGDSLDPYIIRRKTITATAGQTAFTTDVVFTDGYEQIYYNGVLLVRTTDYTTSGSTNTVTLLQGASAGDTVEIISSTPINLVNTITSSGGTITAPNASTVPLTIAGASSQTSNLFEAKNNTGELRYFVDVNGTPHSRAYGADSTSGFNSERYNTGDPVATFSMRGYGGTIASPIAVGADQRIGLLSAVAYDGTSLVNSSRITFSTDGVVSTGNIPGRITFNTAPVGGSHTERMRIDSSGNIGIGATAPSNTRLYVYNNDVSNPVQSVLHNANAGGSRYHIYTSGGADAMSMQWDNNNATAIVQSYSTYPLTFRTNSTEKMRLGTGNDHVNMGFMRTWNIGQPTNMIVSGGTNCIRILINKATAQNYYRGFTFDVHGGGGYDWPGNGLATYFGKFMITFTGTDTGRLHLIQEYSRSYINNSGTEITYNTFSATSDSNYYYLTINFKGINASQGYRPLFSVMTYDAGNGGSTSSTGSNNQVFNVLAI